MEREINTGVEVRETEESRRAPGFQGGLIARMGRLVGEEGKHLLVSARFG